MTYQESRYNMSVILDLFRTLLFTNQKHAESFQNYTKKFRISKKVLKSHIGGPIIILKIFSTIQGYIKFPTNEISKMHQKHVFKQFFAYTCLENAEQSKCGSLLAG